MRLTKIIRFVIGFILVCSIALNIEIYFKYKNAIDLLFTHNMVSILNHNHYTQEQKNEYLKRLAKMEYATLYRVRAKAVVDDIKKTGYVILSHTYSGKELDTHAHTLNKMIDDEITLLVKEYY
ncbi:hypothetical protein LS68_009275 [Helicobacter sp. MIT 05-5293]|uniref:hypothetical protein n=1 Tax=unclassified Helicobacter TaxID=2593540 RepID=UPI00051D6FF4|nr:MULTISPECIES: hypothetical protein [unclassified Helicobacter]TLD79851.1 hypothetical protein LS68_009275 [Helicobacter sp. MIT 05-5293]TLD85524.1 hypothetical protein LS69_009025 [Helicobacter sp. MIT 05-5294]